MKGGKPCPKSSQKPSVAAIVPVCLTHVLTAGDKPAQLTPRPAARGTADARGQATLRSQTRLRVHRRPASALSQPDVSLQNPSPPSLMHPLKFRKSTPKAIPQTPFSETRAPSLGTQIRHQFYDVLIFKENSRNNCLIS